LVGGPRWILARRRGWSCRDYRRYTRHGEAMCRWGCLGATALRHRRGVGRQRSTRDGEDFRRGLSNLGSIGERCILPGIIGEATLLLLALEDRLLGRFLRCRGGVIRWRRLGSNNRARHRQITNLGNSSGVSRRRRLLRTMGLARPRWRGLVPLGGRFLFGLYAGVSNGDGTWRCLNRGISAVEDFKLLSWRFLRRALGLGLSGSRGLECWLHRAVARVV